MHLACICFRAGQVYKAAAGKQTSATQAVAAETAKFREALVSITCSSVRPSVATVLSVHVRAQGKELAAEHVQSDGPCGKCARDFSSPCPAVHYLKHRPVDAISSWLVAFACKEWMNAGGSCHAPSLYKGPCGIVAYTSEMEIGDKVEFQNRSPALRVVARPPFEA